MTIHTPTLPVALGVSVGRMSGALFVPDQNVPQLGVIGQLMVQVDSLTAGHSRTTIPRLRASDIP